MSKTIRSEKLKNWEVKEELKKELTIFILDFESKNNPGVELNKSDIVSVLNSVTESFKNGEIYER